jgi:excisionase family DNA binding protein
MALREGNHGPALRETKEFHVQNTQSTPKPARPLSRLLSISEVAEALGVDVRHVRRLVYERRIPYIKWGHLLRFDPADVSAWIDAHRSRPR